MTIKISIKKGDVPNAPKDGAILEFVKGNDNEVIKEDGTKKVKLGLNAGGLEQRKLTLFLRKIISIAKTNKVKKLHISFDTLLGKCVKTTAEELAERCAADFEMANFEFVKYKVYLLE